MALKDKESWLKLFYKTYGYQPLSEIKKLPGYSGLMEFDEALQVYSETEAPCLIQVVFPFPTPDFKSSVDRFKNGVGVFPQTVRFEEQLWEIDTPVVYEKKLYSLDDFIKKAPSPSIPDAENIFSRYTFSLHYFMLGTEEFAEVARCLTPIKSKIVASGVYPDSRGKNKDRLRQANEKRNAFIINEYIKLGEPSRGYVTELQEKYQSFLNQLPEDREIHHISDNTIRNIVNDYNEHKDEWKTTIKKYIF